MSVEQMKLGFSDRDEKKILCFFGFPESLKSSFLKKTKMEDRSLTNIEDIEQYFFSEPSIQDLRANAFDDYGLMKQEVPLANIPHLKHHSVFLQEQPQHMHPQQFMKPTNSFHQQTHREEYPQKNPIDIGQTHTTVQQQPFIITSPNVAMPIEQKRVEKEKFPVENAALLQQLLTAVQNPSTKYTQLRY
jgi:hypothetical protein